MGIFAKGENHPQKSPSKTLPDDSDMVFFGSQLHKKMMSSYAMKHTPEIWTNQICDDKIVESTMVMS